ncbi:hypothetical protein IT882_12995 [Microbacterium schleiferi]|uniref:HNH endonuclease n=1 Tax=Microbacterium schleiferi TaxID=69362 RepID=A0A7S8MVM7_9MICO|nr:hypothetical protein [Microbacterium schleiferi]QPE04109.1 hypothetical protein IT882_12995 [Microbacterium schleiferi]
MADPTPKVRRGVIERDGEACVSCGAQGPLTFQHRRASGMGGNPTRPGFADGLAACAICNMRFEGDLQTLALLNGWKVPRGVKDPARVPYYHAATDRWYVITDEGPWRAEIPREVAVAMKLAVYGPDGSYI